MEQNKKSNTFAIVGFILSFFTTILGLVLSIVGLNKAKECNSGKGLAIAGIIISIGKFVLIVIIGFLFSAVIWPSVKADIVRSTYCSQAYDCGETDANGVKTCKYLDEFNLEQEIQCAAEE